MGKYSYTAANILNQEIEDDIVIDVYKGWTNAGISRTYLQLQCKLCGEKRDTELSRFNYGTSGKCPCKTGKRGVHSKLTLGTDTYVRDATVEEKEVYTGDRVLKCVVLKCNVCGEERTTASFKFFGTKGNTSEKCKCHVKERQQIWIENENKYREYIGTTDYQNRMEFIGLEQTTKGFKIIVKCTKCGSIRNITASAYIAGNRLGTAGLKMCECDERRNEYVNKTREERLEIAKSKYSDYIGKTVGRLYIKDIVYSDDVL